MATTTTTTPTTPTTTAAHDRAGDRPPTRSTRPSARRLAGALAVLTGILALATGTASPAAAEACPPAAVQHYSDVPLDHPFCREIGNATLGGWVTGYDDGTFRPADQISRQAVAAMLWKAANADGPAAPKPCDPASPSGFTDVPDDHPFCGHIRDAALTGVFEGYPDGTFRPGLSITRQAVAAALVRFRFAEVPVWGLLVCGGPQFTDVPADHPFCEEIAFLEEHGVTDGYPDGSFHPGAVITRQAFVAQLGRLLLLPVT